MSEVYMVGSQNFSIVHFLPMPLAVVWVFRLTGGGGGMGPWHYWPHETSPGYSQEESRKPDFRSRRHIDFTWKIQQEQRVHLLNVCHSGRSALCRSSAELARHWFVPVISVSSH